MLVEEIGFCGGDHCLLLSNSLCFFSLSRFILPFPPDFFSQQNHKITFAPASTTEFEKSVEEREERIKRRKKEKEKKRPKMVQRERKMIGVRKRKKKVSGAT